MSPKLKYRKLSAVHHMPTAQFQYVCLVMTSHKSHMSHRKTCWKLVRVFDCSVIALLHLKSSMADESLDALFFRGALTSKLQKQTPVHC